MISAIVPLAPLQAEALLGTSEFSAKLWSGSPVIGIDDTIRKLINPGAEPSISGLKIIGDDRDVTKKQSLEQTLPPIISKYRAWRCFARGSSRVGWTMRRLEVTCSSLTG